jgi:DNA-binding transcriptional LysR family regulator
MTDSTGPDVDIRQRLPLNSLRAFEAAARLGSMSAAAAELFVTHGAISRHVHALEQRYGLPLLDRLPRSVVPTPEGAPLAAQLAEAFRLMQEAVTRLAPGPMTLSCSATIMMKWLIPKLSEFKTVNPGIEIRLNMSHGEVNFVRDQISLAIRNSMYRAPQDVVIEPLLREQIGPVCHPDYVAAVGISSVESLTRARLLETATRPGAWQGWAQLVGAGHVGLAVHERYEHFYLAIQAASSQLGVTLAPRYLVQEELASGMLVAPFGFVDSPHTLDLWIAPHERRRDDVRKLASWIKQRME